MAHPSETLYIAAKTRVQHPENQEKSVQKLKEKRQENEGEQIMDTVSILGPFWEALGNHFGSQNVSKNRVKFRGRFLKLKKLKKVAKKRDDN